ncbi:MAG TPA: hypothetical protein VIL37_19055 [Natronosporangium sp.]
MRRVLAVGLVFAVAGCAADGGAPSSETDPAVILAASTQTLEEESFRFELSAGELFTAAGAMDPAVPAGSVTVTIEQGPMVIDIESILIESSMWANLGSLGEFFGAETPWLHIDRTRLGEAGLAGIAPGQVDLVGAAEWLRSAEQVEQVDEDTFRGQFQLAEGESTGFADQLLAALGEESLAVAFVATVDDQGRLTELTVDLPRTEATAAQRLELRYFDFGAPVEVSPPPADQVSELPEELYELYS